VKVIRDGLLVRVDDPSMTKGGLYIPEANDKEIRHATVVEAGRGLISGGNRIELEVKVGDKIIFRPTPMIPVKRELENGEEELLHVISEGQVLVYSEQ
jgi:co-chaperonin GroES (HSP10)